jgi:hypothetical protein
MDYDELIEQWQNGNLSDVAREVSQMKPSEIVAFCELFAHRGCTFSALERILIRLEN